MLKRLDTIGMRLESEEDFGLRISIGDILTPCRR
jgi:hypothetical protein